MNYRHLSLCTSVIGCMATTAGAMAPQQPVVPLEKFKVVVEKEPKNTISLLNKDQKDFRFHYAFCMTTGLENQPSNSGASPIFPMKKNSGQFRNGFSTLIKSKQAGTQPDMNGYVRLLVTTISDAKEAKAALRAKLTNAGLTAEQEKQIFISEAVKRIPDRAESVTCEGLTAGSSVGRKITFVVSRIETPGVGQPPVTITVKKERTCKKPIAKKPTKSASERLKSAKDKATASAKKAWSSTKNAASKAKQKVSSAASSAKESFNKRFGK